MSSIDKLKEFFFEKKAFLFDLDGTLYLGKKLLPGAVELIHDLRKRNKKVIFLTNNSSRSDFDYYKKLSLMGFSPKKNEIVMSTHSLTTYLKSKKYKSLFLLGTPSMRSMLKRSSFSFSQNPDCVVVGFDKTLNYASLDWACKLISKGCPWIVTHPDLYCPTEEGPEPDCGAIAKMIELTTGCQPQVTLGKPHPLMFTEAKKQFSAPKSDWIMIGDRLSTDYEFAKRVGIDFLLVLSGETKSKHLSKSRDSSKLRRFHYVSGVKDLIF